MYDTDYLKSICLGLSVLLVDDMEDTRKQVDDILSFFFDEVLTAQDGKEALKMYKRIKPDIVITDLTMPRMDGFELISELRKINPKQKIIVMSAHTETNVIVRAIKSSVDGYILKPIEAQQMFEAVEKAVTSLNTEKQILTHQEELETIVKEQADKIIKQYHYDSLTGLPNKEKMRLDFYDNYFGQIILLNIDNFQQINVTYGYEGGDQLLKECAMFLKQVTNEPIYKGNGDEFFISLKSKDQKQSQQIAEYIKERVYNKRFAVSLTSVRITFSIGIVEIDEKDTDIPYHKANLAITQNRKLHKNIIGHYYRHSEMEQYQNKMHEWANKVKLALDFDMLVPYYQPIVNLATNKVEKYECLARIRDKEEAILPFNFIEPARVSGMLVNITKRIIEKSFTTFSSSDIVFSINITDDDLKEGYLVEYLQEQIIKHGIKPSQVVLEVLENVSNYDAHHAINQIDELKNIGFKIAIDDFGAESSNFARVQKLNIDFIKIDGNFIKDIDQNYNSLIIVKTIIFYAKNSGLKTIAEYVHDKDIYEIVMDLGVDFAQGYYFSEPLRRIEDAKQ